MKIELQHLPDRDLSPNKRLHHIPVYRAKRAAKEEMMWLVKEQGVPKEPMQKAKIDLYVDDRVRFFSEFIPDSVGYPICRVIPQKPDLNQPVYVWLHGCKKVVEISSPFI